MSWISGLIKHLRLTWSSSPLSRLWRQEWLNELPVVFLTSASSWEDWKFIPAGIKHWLTDQSDQRRFTNVFQTTVQSCFYYPRSHPFIESKLSDFNRSHHSQTSWCCLIHFNTNPTVILSSFNEALWRPCAWLAYLLPNHSKFVSSVWVRRRTKKNALREVAWCLLIIRKFVILTFRTKAEWKRSTNKSQVATSTHQTSCRLNKCLTRQKFCS